MYVENKENPVKARPPTGDLLAIPLRAENSRGWILFASLCNLASDIYQYPVTGLIASSAKHLTHHCSSN